MSHLACSDDETNPLNIKQLTLFQALVDGLPWPEGAQPTLGMAASSGCFLGTDYHFDLVRPGAALYGLEPDDRAAESDASGGGVGGKNPANTGR